MRNKGMTDADKITLATECLKFSVHLIKGDEVFNDRYWVKLNEPGEPKSKLAFPLSDFDPTGKHFNVIVMGLPRNLKNKVQRSLANEYDNFVYYWEGGQPHYLDAFDAYEWICTHKSEVIRELLKILNK